MPVLTKINTNVIADDAITGDKFAGDAYLSNTANQNISGTYSENRLYTSDAYTLSGNAEVSLWKRALSQQEVLTWWDATKGTYERTDEHVFG